MADHRPLGGAPVPGPDLSHRTWVWLLLVPLLGIVFCIPLPAGVSAARVWAPLSIITLFLCAPFVPRFNGVASVRAVRGFDWLARHSELALLVIGLLSF